MIGGGAILAAALLIAAPSQSSTPGRVDTVHAGERLREADRLMALDRFVEAAHVYTEAIALNRFLVMAYYGLGKARMGLKEYAKAIDAFEGARKAYQDRAAEYAARQLDPAEEALERKIMALEAHMRLAKAGTSDPAGRQWLEPEREELRRLRAERERVSKMPPGFFLALGSAYFRTGRLADAEREYRAAIAAEPKLGEARVNLAVVLLMTGRPAQAREQLQAARESGYRVPQGLQRDVEAAVAKGPDKVPADTPRPSDPLPEVPSTSDRPRFQGTVDVVAVDATVVDADGRPVPDLGVDAFEVTVDGRPRRVVSAHFVDRTATSPRGAELALPGGPGSVTASADAAGKAKGRLVVLVIDRGELSAGGIDKARQAAGLLLGRLSEGDRVALFSLPDGPRVDFTSDRPSLDEALARIGPAPNVGLIDGRLPLRYQLEALLQGTIDRIDSLEALLARLATVPESKVMVLISGGFTATAAPRDSGDPGTPEFGPSGQSAPGMLPRLRRIATASAAAATSVYTLFVSDHADAYDASRSYGQGLSPLNDNPHLRVAALDSLTAMAGGALFEVVAGPGGAVDRIAREMSGHYTIGLEPAAGDRDGQPHTVEVRVRRKFVHVRARREFVIQAAQALAVSPTP